MTISHVGSIGKLCIHIIIEGWNVNL